MSTDLPPPPPPPRDADADADADVLPGGRPGVAGGGGREPLVLLSGMLGTAALWDAVAARISGVVRPVRSRIDLDASVPGIAARVLAGAPERFGLCGHSLGAIVALEIVRQAPGRVTRLALVNAGGRGPVEAQQQAWAAQRRRTLAGEFEQVAGELARATLSRGRRGDPALLAANTAMARGVGPEGFLRQLSAQTTRPDGLVGAGAVGVPVLVVSGEQDEVCPPDRQRELAAALPTAELVSLAGGHMLPLEAAAPLAAALLAWYARTPGPPGGQAPGGAGQ